MAKEYDNYEYSDYYKNLKNEAYKDMLDAEIQSSVARDQALKYTNASMQQSGYGSQGLAQSTNLGIQNAYQQAMANANQQYAQSVNDIRMQQATEDKEKADASVETDYNNLLNLMSTATNQNQLLDTMKAYNYVDDEGNVNLDSSGLNDQQKRYVKAMYDIYNSDFQNTPTTSQVDLTSDNGIYVESKDGLVQKTIGSAKMSKQISTLQGSIANGLIPSNSYVQVISENGGAYRVYLKVVNGNLYYVSANEYNNANNKYAIDSNNKVYQTK